MHFLSFVLVLPAVGLAAATPIVQDRGSECGTMDMNVIQEDLYAATDDLWPDPDTTISDATKVEMHHQLVQYITTHYSDPCARDALIFGTDLFFTEPSLQTRDINPDAPTDLSIAKRRNRRWKHFVDQMYKASHDIGHAIEHEVVREVEKIVTAAAAVISHQVCSSIAEVAAGATALASVTAPAAPYVGTAVYFWCLSQAQKEVKKALASDRVKKWKASGGRTGPSGLHPADRKLPGPFVSES